MKHYYKNEALFSYQNRYFSLQSVFEGSLDAEMINKIKLDGVPLDAISDLESPESIIKQQLNILYAVIISLSPSLNKIYRIFRKTFLPFVPKDEFAEAYTNFIKKGSIKLKLLEYVQ
jgi:starch synthase